MEMYLSFCSISVFFLLVKHKKIKKKEEEEVKKCCIFDLIIKEAVDNICSGSLTHLLHMTRENIWESNTQTHFWFKVSSCKES